MSDTTDVNPFFPIVLFALACIIYFGSEVSMKWTDRDKLQTGLDQRSKALVQAKQQKAPLEAVVREVVELAKTDSTAKAIVAKHNIRVQGSPAPGAPTP